MSEKDKVRSEWLALAMKWYDRLDEKGKREMFERTSKKASSRWTVKELESAIMVIQQAIEFTDTSQSA